MKDYIILILIIIASCLFIAGCGQKQAPKPSPSALITPQPFVKTNTEPKALEFQYQEDSLDYKMVWSDEFDYEGAPDDSKWGYDVGGSGWGNNELQYYTEGENVKVADGKLVIEARKEDYQGSTYTSTRLVTRNKGDWLYGKIEVSAKLPRGVGTWPAIWMLPTDWLYGNWPSSGEIDIMEHVGYDMNRVHGSIHTKAYNHVAGTQKSGNMKLQDVDQAFHTYAVEWLPDKIKFFIDGEKYFEFSPTEYKARPTFAEWPFDKRFHLIINIAVGGNWGGARGLDESIWPQTLEVDYVRVYQSEEINKLVSK